MQIGLLLHSLRLAATINCSFVGALTSASRVRSNLQAITA